MTVLPEFSELLDDRPPPFGRFANLPAEAEVPLARDMARDVAAVAFGRKASGGKVFVRTAVYSYASNTWQCVMDNGEVWDGIEDRERGDERPFLRATGVTSVQIPDDPRYRVAFMAGVANERVAYLTVQSAVETHCVQIEADGMFVVVSLHPALVSFRLAAVANGDVELGTIDYRAV